MEKLNLLFCGDFAPCRRWFDVKPNTNVFGNTNDIIKNSDLAFVNLESPATNVGKHILKDGPNLRTKFEWLVPIREVGFNLLGLANNHFGDYGEEAVIDCIANCIKLGLSTVGAGKNLKEAQRIFYFEKHNIKVAIIAICEHEFGIAEDNKVGTAPLDVIDNIRQINEAKQNADFVITSIHGGNEYFTYPRPYLRKLCQFYIEQGCDAVICHHPHVPGAYEVYNEKPIIYSLGNFLFDNLNPPMGWNEGYMVKLELSKNTPIIKGECQAMPDKGILNNEQLKEKPLCHCVTSPLVRGVSLEFELIPYTQSFEQGGIKLMTGSEKESFLNRIEEYRITLNNEEKYKKVWKEFCDSNKLNYLMIQYSPFKFRGLYRIFKLLGLSKLLISNISRLAIRLNYIRCESHREVLLKILNDELISRF